MLDPASLELVRLALAEDLGSEGDVTTLAVVDESAQGRAAVIAKQHAVLAGVEAVEAVFREVDDRVKILWEAHDGDVVEPGAVVARIDGPLRAIITAERTALNFLQQLSGVATAARAYVDAAPGVEVRDTRKTTPGMRALEKAAVRSAGGANHRMGLYEGVFLKDNHIAACGGIRAAVERARSARPDLPIRIECETLDQVREAVDSRADEILLDNMDLAMLAEAVQIAGATTELEASGGVTLDAIGDIAATGVDSVSAGAITHSAPAVDFSLELEDPHASRG